MDQPIKTPTGKLMICPICRTPFRRTKQRPHVVTCSTECGDKWRAIRSQRALASKPRKWTGTVQCPLCEEERTETMQAAPDMKKPRIYCERCRMILANLGPCTEAWEIPLMHGGCS